LIRFVLDASVALAWFIDPVITPLAIRVQRLLLQGDRAVVPHLWLPEMANGFVVAQKRGSLTLPHISQAFAELDVLLSQSIDTADAPLPIRRIVSTAQNFMLTARDAVYLETARELRLPIATLDQRLATAAAQAGVPLIS
jgi:predicted nucleic acid-binding protein